MLRVSGINVSYGRTKAVRDVSLNVNKHEIVSLIGSNGAGKTSTLLAISGIVELDSGSIIYNEVDITKLMPHQIVELGICHVPEGRHVFPKLTILENLMTGKSANKKISKAEVNDRLLYVFDMFPRLLERKNQAGGTLSGGEQQMLAIGRGLMNNPDLIILDEPTLGLAPLIIEQIFDMIIKIKEGGKTILLVEQNANMSLSISDRAYVMERGEIILTGEGNALMDNPAVQKAYLGI